MRIAGLAVPLILLVACKSSESKPAPAPATGTGTGTAAPQPDRNEPPIDRGSSSEAPPTGSVSPAPPPATATEQDCTEIVEYFAAGFFEVADYYKVPADGREGAQKAMLETFGSNCKTNKWPLALVDCMGKQPVEKFTYQRCIERLPAAQRLIWDASLSKAIEQAGGAPVTSVIQGQAPGKPFEEVCPEFVAEMSRFDTCTDAGAYMPMLEQVYGERRRVEVGGVIPDPVIPNMKKLCDERVATIRSVLPRVCPGIQ